MRYKKELLLSILFLYLRLSCSYAQPPVDTLQYSKCIDITANFISSEIRLYYWNHFRFPNAEELKAELNKYVAMNIYSDANFYKPCFDLLHFGVKYDKAYKEVIIYEYGENGKDDNGEKIYYYQDRNKLSKIKNGDLQMTRFPLDTVQIIEMYLTSYRYEPYIVQKNGENVDMLIDSSVVDEIMTDIRIYMYFDNVRKKDHPYVFERKKGQRYREVEFLISLQQGKVTEMEMTSNMLKNEESVKWITATLKEQLEKVFDDDNQYTIRYPIYVLEKDQFIWHPLK